MTVKPTTHPTAEVLAAYGLGKLKEADLAAVARHLEACPDCQRTVEKVSPDSFIGRIRGVSPAGSGTQLPATVPYTPPAPSRPTREEAAHLDLPPELAEHPKFRILKELGRGGMGVVYKAENRFMEMTVALKVINKSLLDNTEALERFDREVRAAAKLVHPNIVRALDADRAGELRLLVMEFVEGASLFDVLKKKGPLPIPYACHYARQAALGLQHASEQGMVHRDIKPHNLMLTPRGQVKILDFGLARLASEQKHAGGLTRSGDFMGTPEFVAPEQAMDASKADIRADLYSLGCTLYCLLAGRPPFQEDTAVKLVLAHIEKEPALLTEVSSEVPGELSAAVARMLAKDPAHRFQTPREAAEILAPFCKAGKKTGGLSGQSTAEEPTLPANRTILPGGASRMKEWDKGPMKRSSLEEAAAAGEMESPLPTQTDDLPLSSKKRKKRGRRVRATLAWWNRTPVLAGAGTALLLLALLAGIILKWKVATPKGEAVVVLEIDQSNAEIQVDGKKVTVNVPGDNKPVEIQWKPGRHQLRVSKDGFEVVSREIEWKTGISVPIKVNLEPVKVEVRKTPPPPPMDPEGKKEPAKVGERNPVQPSIKSQETQTGLHPLAPRNLPIRHAYQNRSGKWRIEGNELVQEELIADCQLAFGDWTWRDYDFTCEVNKVRGLADVGLIYRLTGMGRALFIRGGMNNNLDLVRSGSGISRNVVQSRPEVMEMGRWYKMAVRLRGSSCSCYLDDTLLFQYEETNNPRGAVGLLTSLAAARFRNLRVTDPAGNLLFEGLPRLMGPAGQWPPATEPARAEEIRCLEGHGAPVTGVLFSRDGRRLLSCSDGGTRQIGGDGKAYYFTNPASTIRLWDATTGEQRATSPIIAPVGRNNRAFLKLVQAPQGISFLSVNILDSFGRGKKLQLWTIAGDKLQPQLSFQTSAPGAVDIGFTPDGGRVQLLDESGSLWEWSCKENRQVRHLQGQLQEVSCVAFTPDGRRALLSRRNEPFTEIDIISGQEIGRWKQGAGVVSCLIFSPDGRRVLSGGEDGMVRLWDGENGKLLGLLTGHVKPVRAVTFSSDGKRALSGSNDKTVRLWDLDIKKELACFTGHSGAIQTVAFSPDGLRAASGSADYTVRLWRLPH